MADAPLYLRNYDAFYDKLMANFDAMASVAHDKRNLENLSVPSSIPFWGKDLGEFNIEKARDELAGYASGQLSGDYDDLDDLWYSIESARLQLNGRNGKTAEDTFSGISKEVGQIYAGLASWTNSTGDLFRTKYVDTISDRKTKQYEALGRSQKGVRSAQKILIESRKAALQLPLTAKKALEDYSPLTEAAIGTAKVTFSIIGCVVGPVRAALVVVSLETLPTESDLTVSSLMDRMTETVEKAADRKEADEQEVGRWIQAYMDKEYEDWDNYVCSRPASQS